MPWTRSSLAEALRAAGIRPRRSLGQNFVVDANFLRALVRDAGVGPGDGAVEIGAGPGGLTEALAERARQVWAFEIDPAVRAVAARFLGDRPNVSLIGADGADFARHVEPRRGAALRVVSNLPYSDWKRLVLALLSAPLEIASYTLMLQRDVYDRLRAGPGTREYGPMPALVQGTCSIRFVRKAGRDLFRPAPRVESAVFELLRPVPVDAFAVEAGLRRLFAGRRKKSPLAGGRRIEQLSPAELLELQRNHPV